MIKITKIVFAGIEERNKFRGFYVPEDMRDLAELVKTFEDALQECVDAINQSIPEDFTRLSNAADAASLLLA